VTNQASRSGLWSWLVLVGVLLLAGYVVWRNAASIADTYAAMGWAALLGGGALALAGTLTIGMVWRSLLLGMESAHVDLVDQLGTFYVTQLGKYVPGAVWPILAQVAAAGRWGYRKASVVSANLLMMLQLAATGVLLGLLLLPWVADVGRPWLGWAVALVPVLVLLLWPGSTAALLRRLPLPARWRLDVPVTTEATLAGLGWSVATWLLLGGQLWLLLHAAGGRGIETAATALGGAGLAYAVGLVVVFAPAGAGAREAVLVAVCAPVVGAAEALAVALACRLLLTLADVALALVGSLRGAVGRDDGSAAAAIEE
jgi:uncharacterized membrane protein YbhN (UPF0104 family)